MKIALTGGIGSGKSFISKILEDFGIKVYDCDAVAKEIIRTSTEIKKQLIKVVGEELYKNGVLQKAMLSSFLLSSIENQQIINDIVHPAVAKDFIESGYEWLESAIIFESNFVKRINFDHIVCVYAPIEIRLSRIVKRDDISEEKALEWIQNQMPQEQIIKLSDFTIINDGKQDINKQIKDILQSIYNKQI